MGNLWEVLRRNTLMLKLVRYSYEEWKAIKSGKA